MTEFISAGTNFVPLPSPFAMKRGGEAARRAHGLRNLGRLNAARDNAILILTGLSPSAHAAANEGNPETGWWEAMVGPASRSTATASTSCA